MLIMIVMDHLKLFK